MQSFAFLSTAPKAPVPSPTTPPEPLVGTMQIGDVTSHYVYSNLDAQPPGKIPVIIRVGHPQSTSDGFFAFEGQFDEPVLLIRSGLLDDFPDPQRCPYDESTCGRKSAQFLTLIQYYKDFFPIDENRIYLTGFSCDGIYAWVLAYDHPELYAGVVAMSATSDPSHLSYLQHNLDSGVQVVTVVVRGELDHSFELDSLLLEQERETGRIIESLNPNSMWILKEGETHGSVTKYWLEYLKYILRFRK